MRVQVLYFGMLREQMGTPHVAIELPEGSTVVDLLRVLRAQASNAGMADLWGRLAAAVNREYASASHLLRDGDEVALLPPVSGGTNL